MLGRDRATTQSSQGRDESVCRDAPGPSGVGPPGAVRWRLQAATLTALSALAGAEAPDPALGDKSRGFEGGADGIGSVGIAVSDNAIAGGTPQEKAAFGNEVDFFGKPLNSVSEVGFHVFQTGENNAVNADNLPSITFEIDPNLATSPTNFTSLVFLPPAVPSNQWSGYLDGTADGGRWFMTGTAGMASGCNQVTYCDWQEVQAAAPDATVLTLAVTEGRDFKWVGAVDGLRLNDKVYDFEPFGVRLVAP
jgi:hypothetical protein